MKLIFHGSAVLGWLFATEHLFWMIRWTDMMATNSWAIIMGCLACIAVAGKITHDEIIPLFTADAP